MPSSNLKIVMADQMVTLEQSSERHGVRTDRLMENAGLAVAQAIKSHLGRIAGCPILVLVGPGNNGADGLVAARHLRRWGAEVSAYLATKRPESDPKMDWALEYDLPVFWGSEDQDLSQLDRRLMGCRLVLDALLGTGRARPLTGSVQQIAQRVNQWRTDTGDRDVFALDLPTGLNPDTGAVDPNCITADQTLALAFPKVGLLAFPGAAHVGKLVVLDIGLPMGLPEEADIGVELIGAGWVGDHLPARPPNSHKGTFGHTLIVAGSRQYVGAAFLAAQAAVRSGAGLVTLATPKSVYPIAAGKLTEVIHLPLPENEEGMVKAEAADYILGNISRYDSLAVGCGLGRSDDTRRFIGSLLLDRTSLNLPIIIDADGLNNLSEYENWWSRLPGEVILTPHPGEMATLARTTTAEIQEDRIAAARHWSNLWRKSLVLKGAHTVVGSPEQPVRVSPFSNPGLASGGTGDVLTGILAALTAQGVSPGVAASCGVYLHGWTGGQVAGEMGNAGMTASDLVQRIPRVLNQLRRKG